MKGIDSKTGELVDFIIVGSMKAGTTSLHHWLMLSEQISMLRGESHFFNRSDRFEKGEKEYKKFLPPESGNRLVGDDTPTYSFLSEVPERIHSMAPNVKILWILRDPLKRAISQYWHAARKGFETRPINQAFTDELNGKTDNIWKLYLHRSCYKDQIERYLKYFSDKKIHFVNFKDFAANDLEEKRRITDFLKIDYIQSAVPHSNETSSFPKENVNKLLTYTPLHPRLERYIRRVLGYKKGFQPTLTDAIKNEAEAFLAERNDQLRELTGFYL